MTLSPFNKDVNIVSKLDDDPNNTGGLTAAEFKARFDEAANLIKSWLNGTHVPELQKLADIVSVIETVKALQTELTSDDTAIPTSAAVLKAIQDAGGGDMSTGTYDKDKDGVVDAADAANTAKKLAAAITFALSGHLTASASFDGSSDFSLEVTAIDPDGLSKATPISKGGTDAADAATACENLGALSKTAGGNVSGPTAFDGTLTVNEKMILSPYSYGTSLPAAGSKGRLFFLVN